MSNQTTDALAHSNYLRRRKKLSGFLFESALPNEYLVEIGQQDVKPVLGGKRLRLFRKFIRIPASVQTLIFSTDNANVDYQGVGIRGYASWRIDPQNPEIAVKTLDFFDENDPTARTNEELRTICIEAVRHVIANMSIDDALKKKDEIAANLKQQLGAIEKRWGIVFDQVGIEQVNIMSDALFHNLQARFRDSLRLDVERKRMETDREIAREQNTFKEKTELEILETRNKINLAQLDSDSRMKTIDLDERFKLAAKQKEMEMEKFRLDVNYQTEQENKNHELEQLRKQLAIQLLEIEKERLEKTVAIEEIAGLMARASIELEELRRKVSQTYTPDELTAEFIRKLPEVFSAIKVDNYTVLDGGGGSISPAGRFVGELAALLKTQDIGNLFQRRSGE